MLRKLYGEYMDKGMDGQMDKWTDGELGKYSDGWITVWRIGIWMYGWEDGRKERREVGKSDGCYCSVTKSCPTLHDLMECSMPGLPVLYHLPEFAQIHVYWVSSLSLHFLQKIDRGSIRVGGRMIWWRVAKLLEGSWRIALCQPHVASHELCCFPSQGCPLP